MPLYKYIAKRGPEDKIEGTIQAESKNSAIEKLHAMDLVPIRIEEETFVTIEKRRRFRIIFEKVSYRDIAIFSRQLATLIKSGVTLIKSLEVLCQQMENPYLKDIIIDLKEKIKGGGSLSQAMRNYPKVFPTLYTALIEVGENSGTLQEILLRISDFYQRQEEFKAKIKTASVYPMLILILGVLTILFMITYVVPRLTKMFVDMGQTLPLPTIVLIKTSSWVKNNFVLLIVIAGVVYFAFRSLAKSKIERILLSELKLRLPIFGKFFLKAELATFAKTLQILLESGVQLLRGLALSIPVISNEVVKRELERVLKDVEKGESLGLSLKKGKIFPILMVNLSSIGEESGRLDSVMAEIANYYQTDTEDTLKTIISLIEPMMILIVGIAVGFMVIAMLLPIFQISFTVH